MEMEHISVKEEMIDEYFSENASEEETNLIVLEEDGEHPKPESKRRISLTTKVRYGRYYDNFLKWKHSRYASKTETNEKVLLEYFHERRRVTHATLGPEFSTLRSMIRLKENVHINLTRALRMCLKETNPNVKRTIKVCSYEECMQFLRDAPDSSHLLMKVALIIGVFGSCSRQEFTTLELGDFQRQPDGLLITMLDSSTQKRKKFMIPRGRINKYGFDMVSICEKYAALRPMHAAHKRFFVGYRGAQCTVQPVGKNSFGAIPQHIASFLKLPQPKFYTSFKRTALEFKKKWSQSELFGIVSISGGENIDKPQEPVSNSLNVRSTDSTPMILLNGARNVFSSKPIDGTQNKMIDLAEPLSSTYDEIELESLERDPLSEFEDDFTNSFDDGTASEVEDTIAKNTTDVQRITEDTSFKFGSFSINITNCPNAVINVHTPKK